jgi:hypothetical protein
LRVKNPAKLLTSILTILLFTINFREHIQKEDSQIVSGSILKNRKDC